MGEPERVDVKGWNAGSCQIQSKTPVGFSELSYLSLDFKAEADYSMLCLKLPQAMAVQHVTPQTC